MNLLDNRETVRVNHYTAYFFLGISGIVHATLPVHVQLNKITYTTCLSLQSLQTLPYHYKAFFRVKKRK